MARYDLTRTPMPLVLAIAPCGAVTNVFPGDFTEAQLQAAFVSPCTQLCLNGRTLSHSPTAAITGEGIHCCSATCRGDTVREFMAITKALADENRVRVLLALERGELCVCQIVELMALATSTVSKHMSILKAARLVDSRKEGRWIYYRLADKNAPAAVRQAIAWVSRCLDSDPQVVRDKKRLAAICTADPHELCIAQQEVCHHKCK